MPKEVLIIGGGFAGLAAGVALAEAGCRVRLLEQKPYLGGRARSFVEATTGSVVDNGQHLIMGCYRSTLRFFETIGTSDSIAMQPRLALRFLAAGGRLTKLDCPELPAPWHLLAGVLRSDAFTRHEKFEVLHLGRALEAGENQDGHRRLSVREWLGSLGQSPQLQRNFWDLLCIAAMNEDPRIAAAPTFERVLRLALFRSPADSRLGIPRRGLSDCYTDAAQRFIEARAGRVDSGQNVMKFITRAGAMEGIQLSDGARIQAETVVSAVPCFQFVSLLPTELLRSEPGFSAILSLHPAPIISIYLWLDRAITDLEFVGLRGTTIQWLFNKGAAPGGAGQLVSLVLSGAHEHIGKTKDELLWLALHDLESLFPEAGSARVAHSLVLKERFATFSPDCASEQIRPGVRTAVRGLFLAGDWTATGLPATIEGAVKSGYTAARAVMDNA